VRPLDSTYFSSWYAKMETSDKDALWARVLGLPEDLQSTSLLTGPGLDEVDRWLGLRPDDLLLDLACGRGGYGLELARRSGCRVVGVDFATTAIAQAVTNASRMGLAERARFRVGDMAATGLPDASVTAVLCVDAAQFALPFSGPVREAARVLVPGGRVLYTSWQARDRDDEGVRERLRRVDFDAALRAHGFVDVQVTSRPDWLALEAEAWRRVLEVEPDGDPALLDLQEEAREVVDRDEAVLRVMAVGRKPRGVGSP
jgi:SAM-dependent methyltransferase